MSHASHDDIIPHGGAIVERFGGIRPMASKLNVPVTTVQGWKKRDAIPAIRRDEILSAAANYDVDLDGLFAEANENSRNGGSASGIAEDPALTAADNVRAMPNPAPQPQRNQHFSSQQAAAPASNTGNTMGAVDMRQIKSIARRTSFITSAALIAIVAGAGYVLFGGPAAKNVDPQRVAALEGRVGTLETTQQESQPGMLRQTIANLEARVDQIAATGLSAAERLSAIESQIRAGGTPALAGVAQQVQDMASTPQGAASWQEAIEDLRGIVTQMQGRMDGFDSALQLAKSENDALGQTLSEVSGRDLGAAAMLLTLAQVRSSIDRQTPFAEDLAMLRAMAGTSDPELAASIDRMAPYAETGVLSPEALKRELQASANDIITAKLKGEDVSFKDKILGRLQGLFSIKKDGADIAGSQERRLIDQASAQLDSGDVQGAMATLQQLEGPAAQEAAPWQQQAAATLAAQGLESQLVKTLMTKLRSAANTMGSASGSGLAGAAPINMAPMQPQATPQMQPDMQQQAAPEFAEPQTGSPFDTPPIAQPVDPGFMAPQSDNSGLYVAPETVPAPAEIAPEAGMAEPEPMPNIIIQQ